MLGVFLWRSVCSICLHFVLRILAAVISVPSVLRIVLQILPGNYAVRFPFRLCAFFSCMTFDQTKTRPIIKQRSILCLFCLILYVPVNFFSVMLDRSSWVEPVLSKNKCVLLKVTTQ